MEEFTIDEWKEINSKVERMIPSGKCVCAGCDKTLRARKYSIGKYPNLEEFEQPYKYCRECLKNGHDMCFPRRYEEKMVDGKIRYGKRLPTTKLMIADGRKMQRWFHK